MKGSIEFKGAERFRAALGAAELQANFRKRMRVATAQNALMVQAEARRLIQAGAYARNAALTAAIKGSSKPLADKGDLFKSITHFVEDDFTAYVGVMRTDDRYDLAVALHDGFEVSVTPAMRGMFFILWQASTGAVSSDKLTGRAAELFERYQDWLPLKASTTTIVTPPRPFIEAAFQSSGVRKKAEANWNLALKQVFKDVKSKAES